MYTTPVIYLYVHGYTKRREARNKKHPPRTAPNGAGYDPVQAGT